MTKRRLVRPVLALAIAALAVGSMAVVNPGLQPNDLFDRNRLVVAAVVTAIDAEKGSMTLKVEEVLKGALPPGDIVMTTVNGDERMKSRLRPGDMIIAYGQEPKKKGTPAENDLLMYIGYHDWHIASLDPAKPNVWSWKAQGAELLAGTFNGQDRMLLQMMRDYRAGTMFFPAVVFAQFKPDQVLAARPEKPWGGVAVSDLDGDGRLDVLAAAPEGLCAMLQTKPLEFSDGTAGLGLAKTAGASLSLADADGDGRADLLVDGQLWLRQGAVFVRSDRLPAAAAEQVRVATFADLDGDGWVDVLVSRQGGGLRAWRNPGAAGGAFADASAACGLDTLAAQGDGLVTLGDWNLDGRLDIYYAAGKGRLLVQGGDGRFASTFEGGPDLQSAPGRSGAGTFAPLWRQDRLDLAIPGDSDLVLYTADDAGQPEDVVSYGNEIALQGTNQLATLVEDLDMDGYADLYAFPRNDRRSNYHCYRGYGSFMKSELYRREFMPGEAYLTGAGGVVAADIDGDKANDLIVAGFDGRLSLVRSTCLAGRADVDESALWHERKIAGASLIAISVAGQGAHGARVTVADAAGKVVTMRLLGFPVLTGCSTPSRTVLAVREPGEHTVTVRYTDGVEKQAKVSLTNAARLDLAITR